MARMFNSRSGRQTRRALRKRMPEAEVILWSKLQRRQLGGYKFRRQYGVGEYSIDFYCPKLKLAVEVDGDSHLRADREKKDRVRQKYIEDFGIQFIRFGNEDICKNLDGVLMKLEEAVEERKHEREPMDGLGGDPLRS